MKVLIAGGGTGGHLFPGLALAEEFKRRDPDTLCIFVGTERGIESTIVPEYGFQLRTIDVGGLKGKSVMEKVRNLFRIPGSMCQAVFMMREYTPELVIGMGGYASAPVVFGAFLMGIKRVICEQNTIPGIANRILARFVNRVFISFSETRYLSSMKRTRLTGNPIRRSLKESLSENGTPRQRFTLLVLGGSQGAHSINEKVLAALDYLVSEKDALQIIHQSGNADFQWVSQVYDEKGFHAEVVQFIDDMSSAYRDADLVICRAGATTISELTVCGKASILIPYPFAANNHQEINAKILSERGAAKMILNGDVSGENLAIMIDELACDPMTLSHMRKESFSLGRPNACEDVVESCYELLGKNKIDQSRKSSHVAVD